MYRNDKSCECLWGDCRAVNGSDEALSLPLIAHHHYHRQLNQRSGSAGRWYGEPHVELGHVEEKRVGEGGRQLQRFGLPHRGEAQ